MLRDIYYSELRIQWHKYFVASYPGRCSSLAKFYCFIDLLCVYSCQIYYISFVFFLRYYTLLLNISPFSNYISLNSLHYEERVYMDLLYVQYQSLYNMNERKPTIMLNICNENSFLTCAGFVYFEIWILSSKVNSDTCVHQHSLPKCRFCNRNPQITT